MRLLALVGGAPRGECDGSVSSKAKASPRGRGSYRRKRQSAARAVFFVGAATPRRKRWFCQLGSQSFAPRAGLLQKSQSATRAVFCGSRDPRRKRWFCQLKSQKLRPEGGLPTEEPKRRPRRFLWEARPAANAEVLPAPKAKLLPEVGPPTSPRRVPALSAQRQQLSSRTCPPLHALNLRQSL